MNSRFLQLACLSIALAANQRTATAQVYLQNIVGYWIVDFQAGSNLVCNPFEIGDRFDSINGVFRDEQTYLSDTIPPGTTVSLWNPATKSFDQTAVLSNRVWTPNFSLPPGKGFLVKTPTAFTFTFTGNVLSPDGSYFNDDIILPPPFSGPDGIYLLGDKCPLIDVGTNIFMNIIGRPPFPGEQVIKLGSTNTYLGNGVWDSEPTLNFGESAFLNIKSVPPPRLFITTDASNQVIVTWRSSSEGFAGWTLQTNRTLAATNWGRYTGQIIDRVATNPPSAGSVFFRLSYP